jgi:hypothetical protein
LASVALMRAQLTVEWPIIPSMTCGRPMGAVYTDLSPFLRI